jgi:hypothetical protein
MTTYEIDEAQLQISPEWHDQSINVFKLPSAPNGKEASFVVSRDIQRKAFETFEAYVEQQRKQLSGKLPAFKLQKDELINFQDHDGLWLEYTWSNNGNPMHIWQVFYDRKHLALICTMTSAQADKDHFESAWRKTMGAMILRPVKAEEVPEPFPPQQAIKKSMSAKG